MDRIAQSLFIIAAIAVVGWTIWLIARDGLGDGTVLLLAFPVLAVCGAAYFIDRSSDSAYDDFAKEWNAALSREEQQKNEGSN